MVLPTIWNFLMPVSMVTTVINPNCMFYQELVKGQQYYLFNQEYPNNYSAGASCQWVAKSPQNSKIFLSCNNITMPKTTNCKEDRLEIYSNGKEDLSESHSYCGVGSFSLLTKGSSLSVVLLTSTKSAGGRFLCTLTAIENSNTTSQISASFPAPSVQPSCQCGWQNQKRIVGGQDTGVNEYPSMAALVDNVRYAYCGATIISNRFVVTAAHCVHNKDPRSIFVLVGDHKLSTGSDTVSSALYRATAYEIWVNYDPATYQGDIALVMTDQITFNQNVGPICLPFRYSFNTFNGYNVTALGWGQLEFSGANSDTLQKVDLIVISNNECQESTSENIISSEMCTFNSGKDSCQSDSGGPLLWKNQNRLFLLGIISHGVGCGSALPSINTRVTSFLEWIQRRTGTSISKLLLMVQWSFLISQQKVEAEYFSYYQEIIFGEEYYIYNPNYPYNYTSGTGCDWDLRTAAGTKIYVSCTIFNLPLSPNCNADKLLISPTGNTNYADSKNYCGKGSFSLVSQGTKATIGLRTTPYSQGGQFLCIATAIIDTNSTLQNNSLTVRAVPNCACGWKKMTRIVGGEETSVNEFAFMSALIYQERVWCGANIISDRFVLSAGHCVFNRNPYDILLLVGDHNVKTGSDTNQSAIYKISAYELHPEYDKSTQKNDIALLQTATKIIFTPSVGPVCLPFRFTNYDFAGQDVVLLGWGQLEFTGPQPDALQKVHVTIITNQQCSQQENTLITKGQICTYSNEDKDSCQMDSGGPVIWTDTSTSSYQLLGLISKGVGCGAGLPSINTRVTEYLQWIVARTGVSYCIK